MLSAEEISNPKPSPDIFIKCGKKLDIDASECVVIEDSVAGIKAAKEAKMKCIAVLSGITTRIEISAIKPDLIIHSLTEKDKILKFVL